MKTRPIPLLANRQTRQFHIGLSTSLERRDIPARIRIVGRILEAEKLPGGRRPTITAVVIYRNARYVPARLQFTLPGERTIEIGADRVLIDLKSNVNAFVQLESDRTFRM